MEIEDGQLGAGEIKVLAIGFVAAVVAYTIPLTRFLLSALVTLFHELGHAVVGWVFGYPSIPAFDFVYGGGLTHHGEFRTSLAIAIACVFLWLGYLFRENRTSVALIAILFAIWIYMVTREWRREIAFAAAGHFFELVLAGVFLYRALAGSGWHSPEVERPAAAFVAFFVQIESMKFAWRLTHDASFLDWYREGKGGALMNDLEVVALDLQIWLGVQPGIEGVARALFFFSFVPLAIALFCYFKRSRVAMMVQALTTAD